MNSAGTTPDYGTLPVAGGGTGAATLTGILKCSGTSAFTAVAAPTGAILGDSDVQNISGKKTYFNTTFAMRNTLNTFTGTVLNPALTADANLQFAQNSEAGWVVYVELNNGQYTAKNAKLNSVISAGTVAETAIQDALTATGTYGTVIIRDGTYTLSGAFTGFTFGYNQNIIMGRGCNIRVPNGYTGKVFKVLDTSTNSHINFRGGLIDEVGTPAKDWTCFDLNSTSTTGLLSIKIQDTRIVNAKQGIAIRTDTNGFVNGCLFENVVFDLCEIGCEWIHTGVFTDGQSGGNNNTFVGGYQQYVTGTTHGFKDVNGRRNCFINCYVADFTGAAITMNITANAKYTVIIGGSCTFWNFADLEAAGFEALIKDAYQGDVAYNRKTTGYEDVIAISAPSSPSTGTVRRYTRTLDANNDKACFKERLNGAVVEIQI
jgi:hypothetical protein